MSWNIAIPIRQVFAFRCNDCTAWDIQQGTHTPAHRSSGECCWISGHVRKRSHSGPLEAEVDSEMLPAKPLLIIWFSFSRTKTFGDAAFSFCTPGRWNRLPDVSVIILKIGLKSTFCLVPVSDKEDFRILFQDFKKMCSVFLMIHLIMSNLFTKKYSLLIHGEWTPVHRWRD